MGVISDFLANAKTIATGPGRVAEHKVIVRDLERLEDIDLPSGYAAANEVQQIAIYQGTVNGGTFDLDFTLRDGTTFTASGIAFDAVAATIESAIDTAAGGVVAGWTNGDIAVTGGPLTTTALTLTYSGASVQNAKHQPVVIDGANLLGGGSAGAVSVATNGQTDRRSWAVLNVGGVIEGSPPAQGTGTPITIANTRESYPQMPGQGTLRALAREAAIEDGNPAVEGSLLDALKLLLR